MESVKILIVEDEAIVAKDIQFSLLAMGYRVSSVVSTGTAAVNAAKKDRPHLVLVDIMLEGKPDGLEAARQIRAHFDIPVVYITAYSEENILNKAMETEPYGYLHKPFEERELHSTIQLALYKHKTEHKVKEREEWFATTLSSIGDGVITSDPNGLITFMNPVAESLTGWKLKDASGRNLEEVFNIINEKTHASADNPAKKLNRNNDIVKLESHSVLVAKDGREIPVDDSAANIKDDKGNITGVVLVFQDISERKRAEQELEDTRALLQSVIDGVAESIVVIDRDYRVCLINEAARAIHLKDAPLNETSFCYRVLHGRDTPCDGEHGPCPVHEVIGRKKPFTVTHLHQRADGSDYPVELQAAPILDDQGEVTGIIEVGRDISEKLKLEKESNRLQESLFQQQKFQSIATLAGGIAHEFNNILMALLGNVEILQKRVEDRRKERELAGNIAECGERMEILTRQLLAYARGGKYQVRTISLDRLISKALAIAHTGKYAEIKVLFDLAEDLWPVKADSNQMSQMLLNILTNAFEAMEEGHGLLTIRAENIVKEDNWECSLHNIHQAGEYILLRISDTGIGIPKEFLDRIFEPFFTTKFMGRGLGLSAAMGIVQNHGGCITVERLRERGSIFNILLPRAKEAIKPGGAVKPTGAGSGASVLVVDDEPQLLALLKDVLNEGGYDVQTVSGGLAAVEIVKTNKDGFDLVILDIHMADINGREVYRQIKAIKPDMPVLISSGYDEETALAGISLDPGDDFIQKPYRSSPLFERLKKLLHNEAP